MKHFESKYQQSSIKRLCTEKGTSIEQKLRNAIADTQPIEDTAPFYYTESKDGVLAQYDIRTDRFDLAIDATDKWSMSERAKSENKEETIETTEDTKEQEKTSQKE